MRITINCPLLTVNRSEKFACINNSRMSFDNRDGSPYSGDIGEDAWICEDPLLANICVVKPHGEGMCNVFCLRDVQDEQLLFYGNFKNQMPFLYDAVPIGPQIQPSNETFIPRKYNDSNKIKGRLLVVERALAATSGDPIKASQNMFIPTDIPCCSVCNVRKHDLTVKLKVCAGCRQRRYCSTECQTVDWKYYHKNSCASTSN